MPTFFQHSDNAIEVMERFLNEDRPEFPGNVDLSYLKNRLNKAFPVEVFPRVGPPPIMRTMAGLPPPYANEIMYGCSKNMVEDAYSGWCQLLTGKGPLNEEEHKSLELCIRLFVDEFDSTGEIRHLRPLWYLVAE